MERLLKNRLDKLNYRYTNAASCYLAMELLKQTGSTCTGSQNWQKPVRGGQFLLRRGPDDERHSGQADFGVFSNQDVAFSHVKAGKL